MHFRDCCSFPHAFAHQLSDIINISPAGFGNKKIWPAEKGVINQIKEDFIISFFLVINVFKYRLNKLECNI